MKPHLLKLNMCVGRKNKLTKKNRNKKNIFFGKFWKKNYNFLLKKEAVSISFHLRPCLLKSDENFLKYLAFGTISRYSCAKKRFFTIQQNFLRAHQNALQIFSQCIKTFQMSYQRPLYALFHPPPSPAPPLGNSHSF